MFPLYGKHFTRLPSSQLELFLSRNPICLIFKVLASFSFLFYFRSSVASDPLIRSEMIIQRLKPLVYKDFMNINLTIYINPRSGFAFAKRSRMPPGIASL